MPDAISYSRQSIDEDDIAAVTAVLRSDFLTQGPMVAAFESALSVYTGCRFAAAFSSGTAALHAAYFAAGIGGDHEVITSSLTFAATSNAALYLGAKPIFVDVERDTGNIDPLLIEQAIGPETKAIVPIHYAGHPVDLDKIMSIARRHNLLVIEDACHAIGAEYLTVGSRVKGQGSSNGTAGSRVTGHGSRKRGRAPSGPCDSTTQPLNQSTVVGPWDRIGSCSHSDMAVFSFHPVKPITSGEGGAVLTNNRKYYDKLIMFRSHGITKDRARFEARGSRSEGDWYYEMQLLGYNYRLTDLQAALGTSQLKKLDAFTERRRAIVQAYAAAFGDSEFFEIPVERPYARSSWHLYPLRLKPKYAKRKKQVFESLKGRGIKAQVHYIPVYLQPYYQKLGYKKGLCPEAERFYRSELSIPLYPSMSDKDVGYVIKTIKSVSCT